MAIWERKLRLTCGFAQIPAVTPQVVWVSYLHPTLLVNADVGCVMVLELFTASGYTDTTPVQNMSLETVWTTCELFLAENINMLLLTNENEASTLWKKTNPKEQTQPCYLRTLYHAVMGTNLFDLSFYSSRKCFKRLSALEIHSLSCIRIWGPRVCPQQFKDYKSATRILSHAGKTIEVVFMQPSRDLHSFCVGQDYCESKPPLIYLKEL